MLFPSVRLTPPPHSNVQGGRMRIPIYLGKGVYFGCLSREDFPEKTGKGGVFKPTSRDMGSFSEASREIKKKGV